jgi:hypothetical protein
MVHTLLVLPFTFLSWVGEPERNDETLGVTEWKPSMRDTSVWTSG